MSGWKLSDRAGADVRDIYFYSSDSFGSMQAERYIDDLERQFDRLAERPLLGRRFQTRADVVLRFTHRSHAIFYECSDDGILILRVLHQSMDPARHL